MTSLFRSVAAIGILSLGASGGWGRGSGKVPTFTHLPPRDHYTSDEPLSKRAKRRKRGRAGK